MAYADIGGGKRRQRSAVAVLCMALFAPLAWANVDQALLEKAEALLKANQYEEAYALLEPWELAGAGDPVYDYLLGTAALESNRPSKASFVYERILAVTPDYIGVRADMGRAYLALGDYGRAKIEFESVLSIQNLPPDLRSAVEQYAKAAEARAQNKRTVAAGYAELGVEPTPTLAAPRPLHRSTCRPRACTHPHHPRVKKHKTTTAPWAWAVRSTTTLSAGWLTSLGDGSAVFSLTGAYGIERAVGGRDDGDRRFFGPRMTLQKSFAEKLGAYASLGATYSKYAGTNSLYMVSRDESLYDIALGMSLTMGKGLSVRPQFSATRNTSNAELYSYDKNDFSVNIRLDY